MVSTAVFEASRQNLGEPWLQADVALDRDTGKISIQSKYFTSNSVHSKRPTVPLEILLLV